jgi:hypothetical protein
MTEQQHPWPNHPAAPVAHSPSRSASLLTYHTLSGGSDADVIAYVEAALEASQRASDALQTIAALLPAPEDAGSARTARRNLMGLRGGAVPTVASHSTRRLACTVGGWWCLGGAMLAGGPLLPTSAAAAERRTGLPPAAAVLRVAEVTAYQEQLLRRSGLRPTDQTQEPSTCTIRATALHTFRVRSILRLSSVALGVGATE